MKRAYTNPVSNISESDFLPLAQMAWKEDCPDHDITTESIFPKEKKGKAKLVPREKGVLCGSGIISVLAKIAETEVNVQFHKKDGDSFSPGECLMEIEGSLWFLLRSERILLNLLQYLSGIASQTHEIVEKFGKNGMMILDTRKTLPGYRKLAKYAVYCGGGANHRLNLSEMAMVKDNHVAAAGSISKAVESIRTRFPGKMIELEIDRLDQLDEALLAVPDVLLLDNFSVADTRIAVQRVQETNPEMLIECSGGITPEKLQALSEISGIGVSMGYLTHTTRFLDLSLEMEPAKDGPSNKHPE